MPKLGMTMQEARILEWHSADGDAVRRGEVLFTIESEKAALDIEAPADGVLRILVPAGETVGVLEPVAELLQVTARLQMVADEPSATESEDARVSRLAPASPKAREAARRAGVSLTEIEGTGPRSMIVLSDVERNLGEKKAPRQQVRVSPVARRVAEGAGIKNLSTISGSGPGGRIMREDVERVLVQGTEPPHQLGPELEGESEVKPLSGPRAVIAQRLSASWRERPHVTLTTEADASNLVSARQQINAEGDTKISYNALLIALVASALREHAYMNVSLTEKGIERRSQVNIGVAVDTDRGLLVPVVRGADTKALLELEQALQALVERAIAGESLPDELTGGTFTITNLGPYDIGAFTPIINPPETAILGVGRIVAKPVAVDGQVVVRDSVVLSLSFDHRVVDGAPAARFLQRVKQLIERPFVLVLDRSG